MLIGQSGDGIKGCKGKGKVYAKNLLVGDYKEFRAKVWSTYQDVYSEGAENEFAKNYTLLKILDIHDEFRIPEINKYNKYEINLNDY